MRSVLRSTARRAIAFVRTVVVVISLALAAAFGWAWWHAAHVYQDRVELVAGGRLIGVVSEREGLTLLVVRRWPWEGAGQLRATSAYEPTQVEAYAFHPAAERTLFAGVGRCEVRSGRWQTFLTLETVDGPAEEPDVFNPPVRVSYADPAAAEETLMQGYRWSVALPFVQIANVSHGFAVAVAASPAAAWAMYRLALLAARGVRAVRRRSAGRADRIAVAQ